MARIDNKALFFTTSPRTPSKMIPEIRLLHEKFEGKPWISKTQEEFIDELAQSEFFEGIGSPSDKAFSARDRINRAPKALGFVDLTPRLHLTPAGNELVFGSRPQEIFLRQLLKFQLPSPFHIESSRIKGAFFIRPYLEILRLIRDLDYLTFDELRIFALQLTDYRRYNDIKAEIISFRKNKKKFKGRYRQFVDSEITNAILKIYDDIIHLGRTRTRETEDASLRKFIRTKKSNFRDYADACFRYLRYTGLVSIAQQNRSLSIFNEKLNEIDYILATVERQPVFIDQETNYKAYLYDSKSPTLYNDVRENVLNALLHTGEYTKETVEMLSIDSLKDLLYETLEKRKERIIEEHVAKIKTYSMYEEIKNTYDGIMAKEYYDAPLMFEYNTWRAMTMLNGGNIHGNFKFDDAGQPLSTASGNMPDIECDYDDYVLSVEVTLQTGQRQYEAEGEPVARHYGKLKKKTGKDTYCLFIAPSINQAALAHFYALNKMEIDYYGGKSKIIPLDLEQFIKLVDVSYSYKKTVTPNEVREFLDNAIRQTITSRNESEWHDRIKNCVESWLLP
jgi:hypothetical protein